MKVIFTTCLLVILTVSANVAVAQTEDKQQVDPSLTFFVALYSCRPGNYQETNIMAQFVGPDKLEHTINGMVEGGCSADIATPDGRYMHCIFSKQQLDHIDDQHFMTGALTATTDDPGAAAIRTDKIWTQMKIDSCYFVGE